uniref:TSC22 domain family protein 1 n=1 Tax=Vombatus ursinus TaxID=29139 RepID=A0A4X2M0A6_VOMUR
MFPSSPSHLMFAVREEVEVLKEQIRELAERNAALEQENGLLRALASPEQLAQLPNGLPANLSLAIPLGGKWPPPCPVLSVSGSPPD